MSKLIDEQHQQCVIASYHEKALTTIVPPLVESYPQMVNTELSGKLYDFLLSVMNVDVDDLNDRASVVEDVFSAIDHDLSGNAALNQYGISCDVLEHGQDPVIKVVCKLSNEQVCNMQLSFSAAKLMARKRQLELAV